MDQQRNQNVCFDGETVQIQTVIIRGVECLRLKDVQRQFPSATALCIDRVQLSFIVDDHGNDLEPLHVNACKDKVIEARAPKTTPITDSHDHFDRLHSNIDRLLVTTDRIDANTQETLNQMKYMMRQMYELHEFTTPRYFFILPAKHHDWAMINAVHNWFQLHYKLYFLCECSDDPKELHVAPHDGYSIKKPKEFIARYGPYLQTTLHVVEILLTLTGFVIPQSGNASSMVRNSIPECLQPLTNFDRVKKKVEFVRNLLDQPNTTLTCVDSSINQQEKSRRVPLQGADLRELQSYLEAVDSRHSLGNLYRITTVDGHVRWVCLEHYDAIIYNNKMSEYISQLEAMGGQYNSENKEALINEHDLTNNNVQMLSEALTKGFPIVNLVLKKCSIYENDLNILLDVVMNRSSIQYFKMITVDVRNWFKSSKYICQCMRIHFTNQSFKVRFCDYYQDGNIQMFVRLLLENKIRRTIDFSACDFFGYEKELRRSFLPNGTLTELIVKYSNNIELLDAISAFKINKLEKLKLNYSLCSPSVSSHFCEMLKKNQTLVEIDIMDPTGYSDETFITNLLRVLRKHKSIKQLSLHICDVKPSSQNEICLMDSLSNDKFISRLCISQSVISHKLIQILVRASQDRRLLTHLEFYNSQIDADDVSQLELLHNNEALIHLVISEQLRSQLAQEETRKSLEKKQFNTSSSLINSNTKWKQDGITIAGGNDQGNQLNQLSNPFGIHVDDNKQIIYIADFSNHRIIEWKSNATIGQVVAGGNGQGNQMSQLNCPTGVTVDEKNNSLIICDMGNRRVVRWSRQNHNTSAGKTIIFDIDCWDLTMNNNGDLYISDWKKNEVRRWKKDDENGMIIAGGNGEGNNLNQLHHPTSLFVDENHSLYVSDSSNYRVMKWMKGANEGIVVAGGQGWGNNLTQLSRPYGVFVDQWENVYVADFGNHRIMCWSKGSIEGLIVIGGNGHGNQPNQFKGPQGLSFDQQGNLYVVDCNNNRVQKFLID